MKPHAAAGICLRFSPLLLMYPPGQPVVSTSGVDAGRTHLAQLPAVGGNGVGEVDDGEAARGRGAEATVHDR